MKNSFFLSIGLVLIIGSIYLFLQSETEKLGKNRGQMAGENVEIVEKRAFIGEAEILLEIADTNEKRIKGLSSRESLEEGRGMLFVFDDLGFHGIWMKDMMFPIDIVWLDENLSVTNIEKEVGPETFPKVFYPNRAIKYVLELPSGFADKLGIDTGVSMYLEDENRELSPMSEE